MSDTALTPHIDMEELVDRLSGRDGGLRSSKPDTDRDNGLIQYVWRTARFHGGHDTSLPVTAGWWLQEYLDDHGIEVSVSGVLDDEGKRITTELEEVAEEVLIELGENPDRGAARWAKTGAIGQ